MELPIRVSEIIANMGKFKKNDLDLFVVHTISKNEIKQYLTCAGMKITKNNINGVARAMYDFCQEHLGVNSEDDHNLFVDYIVDSKHEYNLEDED